MNTSNGFEFGYYQPKEIKMFFWNCINEKCAWQSEAMKDENDLPKIETCPGCKCNSISLESDFFEVQS